MGTAARKRKPTDVSQAAAGKRFGKYKPVQEKAFRKADVKEDETLRQLKEIWEKREFVDNGLDVKLQDTYEVMAKLLEGLDYTAKDVEKFSLALKEFQDEKYFSRRAGIFLSALMNRGKDDNYIIHTSHMEKPIHSLGYRNRKNIAVKGDVGYYFGAKMASGIIAVRGNVTSLAGWQMEGGTIWIKGNAGRETGSVMRGGMIVIKGNADILVGWRMRGGKIIVNGNAESIGPGHGGEIHVNGNFWCSNESEGVKVFHRGMLIRG